MGKFIAKKYQGLHVILTHKGDEALKVLKNIILLWLSAMLLCQLLMDMNFAAD